MHIFRLLIYSRRQYGDTIVEVLISIAIVSVVITGAYAIANRSLRQGITASEHTEALKLAEGQVESFKFRQQAMRVHTQDFIDGFATPVTGNNFLNFCLDTAATNPQDAQWGRIDNGKNPDSLVVNGRPNGNYALRCTSAGPDGLPKYYINISLQPGYDPVGPNQCTPYNAALCNLPAYLVTVRWEAIGGGPTAQTQLYYRF